MEKSKIQRINFLAKKSKSEGLTAKEKIEQAELRDEYRCEYKKGLMSQLERVYIKQEDGLEKKLIQ